MAFETHPLPAWKQTQIIKWLGIAKSGLVNAEIFTEKGSGLREFIVSAIEDVNEALNIMDG